MEEIKIGATRTFLHTYTQEDFNRFAELSGDDNPIHVDPDFAAQTRFGGTVAHGMLIYSTLCGFLGSQFPGPGTLQIFQEMTFRSPTYVGEQIRFEIQVNRTYPDSSSIELNSSTIRPSEEFGLQGKSIVSMPGKPQDLGEYPFVATQHEDSQVDSFKGLKIGQSVQLERSFTQSDLDEYLSISGDGNPLFTSVEFAQEAGFKNKPLPGGLLGGMYSCLLGTDLPGRGTAWLKQSLHFPVPAYLDERITASVEIIRLRPEKNLVNLHTISTNPLDDVVCEGEALVYVKGLDRNSHS
jgi:acyl dehydratase